MVDMTTATPSFSSSPDHGASGPGSPGDVAGRLERIPRTRWHTKSRMLIGTATFFDAFDALTIAQVLPVLSAAWALSSGQIGMLIAVGYFGQLIGALALSALADRVGRVPAMIVAIVIFATMSLACAFSWGFWSLLIFRAIQGIGLGGQVPIAAVYISEISKAQGRGRFVLLYELIFSVGVLAAGILGYWMVPGLGWQSMFIVGVLPILAIYGLHAWLPESPRWLAGRGRYEEADASARRIEDAARSYVGELPPVRSTDFTPAATETRWRELFSARYARRTLVVWTIWFGTYLVYYGISTWLPTLYHKTFHLSLETSLRYGLISTAVGFIGAALCAFTIDLLGRKLLFSISLTGSAIFLGALTFSGEVTPTKLLILGSGAYFFAAAASIALYLYTPELYPTRMRAIGVGAATAWLRLASMAGPLVIGAMIAHGLPAIFAVFGLVSILAAVIVMVFAVETKKAVLEQVSP